jgi:membrane-associated phospholipid phosphatase
MTLLRSSRDATGEPKLNLNDKTEYRWLSMSSSDDIDESEVTTSLTVGAQPTPFEKAIRILGLQIIGIDAGIPLLLIALALWMTNAVDVTFDPLIVPTLKMFGMVMLKTMIPILLIGLLFYYLRSITRENETGSSRWQYFWQDCPLIPTNILHFCRILLVLLLSTMWVSNIKPLIPLYNSHNYDMVLRAIDESLFLGHDPFVFLSQFRAHWFENLMNFSYRSLFLMFFMTLAVLFVQKRYVAMRIFVLSMVLSKMGGNFVHFIFPTMGDVYTLDHQHLYENIPSTVFTRMTQTVFYYERNLALTNRNEYFPLPFLGIAAFPSLHCCQYMLILLIAKRYHRFMLWFYIPMGCLMVLSTMWWGWHYVSDIVAGFLLAGLCYWGARWLIAKNLGLVHTHIRDRLPEV